MSEQEQFKYKKKKVNECGEIKKSGDNIFQIRGNGRKQLSPTGCTGP